MIYPLWNRLSYQIGIIIFLGFISIIGFIFVQNYQESSRLLPLHAMSEAQLESSLVAEAVANGVRYKRYYELWDKMGRIVQREHNGGLVSIAAFAIVNDQFQVLAHTDPENYPLLSMHPRLQAGERWVDDRHIEIVQQIAHPTSREVIGYVLLTFEAENIDVQIAALKQKTVLPLLVALFLAIALAMGASFRVSRPLRHLAVLSKQVGSGKVNTEDFEFKPDEIKHLAYSIQWADERIVNKAQEVEKLAMVVQQADEIVIVTDARGIISYVNPSFERVTGYSYEEAVGKSPGELVKGEELSGEYYQKMWDTLRSGKAWRDTFYNVRKNGDRFEVSQSISPIFDKSGNIIAFASVQRDITQLRQMEDKLLHMDRVESLGVLAGGIAHDFNNLLTAILGNASLAMLHLDDNSPAYEHLEQIEGASYSAADLCRQMLAYSGKGKFVVKTVNLSQLVRDMSKLVDVSIAKNVELKYELAEHPPLIKADVAQMQQVVLNLITNASEAMEAEQGGTIWLSTGRMMVSAESTIEFIGDERLQPGSYAYLEVSDNGCGMDEYTQKKIFDPFFTTKFTGRGLGMSAMLGIVNGHHGALRIDSAPGKGTSIRVLIPEDADVSDLQDEDVEKGSRDAQLWSGTVLLVDDEEHLRDVASAMLKKLGFDHVVSAHNGREALELFEQHRQEIRFVLLDVTMPVMGGEECFSQLRQLDPALPVIVSSGYSEQESASWFAGKASSGFLQKPYTTAQLADKIREVLQPETIIH